MWALGGTRLGGGGVQFCWCTCTLYIWKKALKEEIKKKLWIVKVSMSTLNLTHHGHQIIQYHKVPKSEELMLQTVPRDGGGCREAGREEGSLSQAWGGHGRSEAESGQLLSLPLIGCWHGKHSRRLRFLSAEAPLLPNCRWGEGGGRIRSIAPLSDPHRVWAAAKNKDGSTYKSRFDLWYIFQWPSVPTGQL